MFSDFVRFAIESGTTNTNPSSGREEDLNPGPPDYKFSSITTGPCCVQMS